LPKLLASFPKNFRESTTIPVIFLHLKPFTGCYYSCISCFLDLDMASLYACKHVHLLYTLTKILSYLLMWQFGVVIASFVGVVA